MVSQFQRDRMGVEIGLLAQIRLLIFSNIVINQDDWDNQRNEFLAILIKYFEQFCFSSEDSSFLK